jgi:hypothetical protein
VSWIKKTCGLGLGLGLLGLPLAACVGSNQLVGSDGLTAGGGPNVAGASDVAGVSTGGATFGPTKTFSEGIAPGPESAYKCLPFTLPRDETGQPTCTIVTALRQSACGCSEPGLAPTTQALAENARAQLQTSGACDIPGTFGNSCSEFCICELSPAVGASLVDCETAQQPAETSSGWCYVSAQQGSAQAALVASCPENMKQRVRLLGSPALGPDFISCIDAGSPVVAAGLGEPCVAEDEYSPDFSGFDAKEVNINDRAPSCSSNFCILNHFQGRASCPYGQGQAGGGCLVPGSAVPVSVAVAPQLVRRQAAEASICSCHCAGNGPGPFCTCPDTMQCEHLVDDLGLGPAGTKLSGSYCIPRGSAYDPSQLVPLCAEPNCGDAHPY